ncbi:MAG TPA: hypothetical protein VFM41_06055 [Gaiella sp.]|nr:hypothetical protein [Gaiella sp.]
MSDGVRTEAVDLDAEREVDLRSGWERISARWWLPIGGLVVGAILGILVALAGGDVYKAETLLYLGQPFTPGGAGQIQSLATNPKTVSETIHSEAALKRAARASNLSLSQLRGNVTSTTIVQAGQTKSTSPLVQISVQAPAKAKSSKAANSLARTVIGVVAPYVDQKITLLQQQIDNNERQLEEVDRRIAIATQQQNLALAKNSPLSLTEKLLVSTNSNATINSAEGRRASIQSDLTSARQLLSLAENVERSRVVVPAVSAKTSAVSRRTAAAIGGLIGLLLGGLAAILADPWLQRRSTAETS